MNLYNVCFLQESVSSIGCLLGEFWCCMLCAVYSTFPLRMEQSEYFFCNWTCPKFWLLLSCHTNCVWYVFISGAANYIKKRWTRLLSLASTAWDGMGVCHQQQARPEKAWASTVDFSSLGTFSCAKQDKNCTVKPTTPRFIVCSGLF